MQTLLSALDQVAWHKERLLAGGDMMMLDKLMEKPEASPTLPTGETAHPETMWATLSTTADSPNTLPATHHTDSDLSPAPPLLHALLIPCILVPVLNYTFLAFTDQAFATLQPLMYSSLIAGGGLGLSTHVIGTLLGVWGALNVFVQVVGFMRLHARLSTCPLYTLAFASYLTCFGVFLLMHALTTGAGAVNVRARAVLVTQLTVYYICMMVHSAFLGSCPSAVW